MRVKDLKAGDLLSPKPGYNFLVYSGYYASHGSGRDCVLECSSRPVRIGSRSLGGSFIIYLGMVPKKDTGFNSYEARREVFIVNTGEKMRVMPDSWRNMEKADACR